MTIEIISLIVSIIIPITTAISTIVSLNRSMEVNIARLETEIKNIKERLDDFNERIKALEREVFKR